MSTPRLLAAEGEVRAARARLFATLGEMQARLRPANLAQDAVQAVTQRAASAARTGTAAVRRRPLAVAAVAGAIGLVMARGWIMDLLRARRHGDATAIRERGLNSNGTKRARRGKHGKKGQPR